MILNQEQIRRMTGAGGGGAGGGGSFNPSAAGMASQSWVEENYVSKQYFGRLFTANGTQKVYTSTDGGATWGDPVTTAVTIAPNEITPSETTTDGETSGTKIKTVRELSSIQALVGFWTQQYLSALGQNSSGGGGGGGSSTLAGLLDVSIPNPMTQANNGQVLMYNYSQNKWINANLPPTGVTSVGMTVPTGFSVSTATITSSGTFAISFASGYSLPLTADVNKGVTAYGWGDHAQAGYATPSSVASQMQTYAKIQSGTITIGDNSITPLTQHQTVDGNFWGQSWNNRGTVSGSINAGNNGGQITGFHSIELNNYGTLSDYGGFIDFHMDGYGSDYTSRLIETDDGIIKFMAKNSGGTDIRAGFVVGEGKTSSYIQIGTIRLVCDSNENLRVVKANGTAASMYATGGVSALGITNPDDNPHYITAQRYYLDASRYLFLDNGTLKYNDNGTIKTVAFI